MANARSDNNKKYTNMVSNNAENPRQLWNCINNIINRVPAQILPSDVSTKSSCDSFSSHVKNKISLIRSALFLSSYIILPNNKYCICITA